MARRGTSLLMLFALAGSMAWNQGLNTQVNKNDWEEINFDFDSSILVDGFPSLLRLAEQLQANPGHRVNIEGYTDRLGSAAYNQTLGLARANSVRDFLLKYGASPSQLTTSSKGATAPLITDQGNTFRRTDEARFMNRRVSLTVSDAQGRPIGPSEGSAGDAIRTINGQAGPAQVGQPGQGQPGQAQAGQGQAQGQGQQGAPGQAGAATTQQLTECCDQVLKRLDKLDEIAALMKDLADQNAQLRRDVDGLRQNQLAMQNALQGPGGRGAQDGVGGQAGPGGLGGQATASAQGGAGGQGGNNGFSSQSGAGQNASGTLFGGRAMQSLNFTVGSDDQRRATVSGRGRFFAPVGNNIGFQAQGEYYYLRGQREGQFDLGIVDRFTRRMQVGLFGSFKTVSLTGNQNSGTLGQGSFVLDYFFGRGKIGIFASKAFMDNALINRANPLGQNGLVQRNIIEERYLKVVEQVGVASTFALVGNTYAEANVGYLRSTASSNRVGGSLRFVLPMSDRFAFTVEGGVNETFLPFQGTQQGRAAVGVQLGNFMRPKEYLAADHAVPMEIPRVRYETLTRRTRTGNDPPVADAGPDLANVSAGVVQLDGSNSSDPDGDPLTYQWIQEAGPATAISQATAAKAAFTAVAGQTYIFRLLVKDDQGGQASDRVQISTGAGARVQILSFESNPRQVNGGEVATLSWRVLNADNITISGLGEVPATGSRTVTPSATSTYILTAKNAISEESATTTVVITASRFLTCFASPATIKPGETSTLTWQSNGATGVSIVPGIGSVGANGSVAVKPTANTTYVLTTSGGALSDSCTVNVSVNTNPGGGGNGGAGKPAVIRFSASPSTIEKGEKTNLEWSVIDADSISISTMGGVPQFGNRLVSPTESTTYVLTATNANGSVTANVQVTVFEIPLPVITSFTVDKPTIPAASTPVKLTCSTTGAVTVRIGDQVAQFFTPIAVLDAYPPVDTTYTCLATNSKGQTTTQSVSVKIAP